MKTGRIITRFIIAIFVLAILLIIAFHKDLIQRINLHEVVSRELDGRLMPHRINSHDRLMGLLENGIRSFELDLIFRSNEIPPFFEVGHDEAEAGGLRLDQFLETVREYKLKKIWMDIKNLNPENIGLAVSELNRLDSICSIKTIAIIESSLEDSCFKNINALGFHTSYYLPTAKITALLDRNDSTMLGEAARAINIQIMGQSVSAVSFNLSFYPFVKNYLEPIISDAIVYHAWDSVKMWEWNALRGLEKSDYFKDPRIRTILYKCRD
jgi:hypothetical protein